MNRLWLCISPRSDIVALGRADFPSMENRRSTARRSRRPWLRSSQTPRATTSPRLASAMSGAFAARPALFRKELVFVKETEQKVKR